MQHEVARAEAVLAAFEMRLPDQVDDIDVVERADDALEESLALFLGLARRQGGDAIERHLVRPGLVLGEHLDSLHVDHVGNLSMPLRAIIFGNLPLPPRRAAVAGSRAYRKWRGAAPLRGQRPAGSPGCRPRRRRRSGA